MRSIAFDLVLALRNILRQRRRSGIALAAIVFGVVALLLAAGFIEWIFWAMREDTVQSRLGHLQISRPGYQDKGRADPFAYLLPERSEAFDAVVRLSGLRAVAPRLSFSGLVSHRESTLSFIGEGVDPVQEAHFSRGVLVTDGAPLSHYDPNGIVLGAGLAANLGVSVGDTVVLLATTPGGGINAVEARVRGLFSTITKAYDDSAVRVPIAMAQELLRVRGAHVWVVLLDRTELTSATWHRLRQEPALAGYDIVPWTALADFYNKTVVLFSRQVGVVRLIIAVIIVLSITNTMMMSVMERTGEIGTSMALGVPRRRVLRLFLAEGALLGAIGGLIGLAGGYGAALAISAVGIPMPPPPGMARGFTGQILVTPELARDTLALAVATALAASVYPAWKASRLVIVDALRHNR
jgi:putative ABC transport system permease protein